MIIKVSETIKKHNMIPEGATVIAGVSGGSDSMAMLFILNKLKDELGFRLKVAHVNHGIRGEEADSDERFVIDYCRQNEISFRTATFDVIGDAARLGKGLEEVGRQVRYEFFSSFGEDVIIATAHNLSDKTETFLFNYTRGSTLRGLCSIPAKRGNIIRPLIDCTKAEIESFCEENAIPFVTDSTNIDTQYSRNRIRHNVVSQLKEINPSFENCAMRCMESLKDDEDFLDSLANEIFEKSKDKDGYIISVLNSAAKPIKKRVLIKIIEERFGITPEYESVNSLYRITENAGKCEINGGIVARIRAGRLEFPGESVSAPVSVELCEGVNQIGEKQVVATFLNDSETINSQNILKEYFNCNIDCDKIQGRLILRSRKEGDKISLAGRGCTKTLKKLFNEKAIPPEKRNGVIVAADDDGIVAVEGIGADSHKIADKNSKRILKLSFMNEERQND